MAFSAIHICSTAYFAPVKSAHTGVFKIFGTIYNMKYYENIKCHRTRHTRALILAMLAKRRGIHRKTNTP